MGTCRPEEPSLPPFSPRSCAAFHDSRPKLVPPRREPRAAAERPEDARTESSEASSISLRILATERNTPGSMGGGVAFPGFGEGSGGGGGRLVKRPRGESGEEWSPTLAKPRLLGLYGASLSKECVCGVLGSEAVKVLGSRFSTRRDSSSSRGSCSHGPLRRESSI